MSLTRQLAVRSISKAGNFSLARDALQQLSVTLTDEQALSFYVEIRDNSGRPESEWRDEFLSCFPRVKDRLPAASSKP